MRKEIRCSKKGSGSKDAVPKGRVCRVVCVIRDGCRDDRCRGLIVGRKLGLMLGHMFA